MFYSEDKAIQACEEEPSLIFQLMKEGHFSLVDQLLSSRKVNINEKDEIGNTVLMKLLKYKQYGIVLKYMGKKDFEVNHQNDQGDTFAHILVRTNYVQMLPMITKLRKNKQFVPNIKNNEGQTVLDIAINNHHIYSTFKILEDARFNNIDLVSFQKLCDTFINTKMYGRYTRLTNFEIIIDRLEEKPLLPNVKKVIDDIKENIESCKQLLLNEQPIEFNEIIGHSLEETNA